ncbi:MAG TPA: flagellar assembly protein FliW [Bacillota bacterium]|nr:flagellar assembly protein FliW [Bacillota bacterium]
MILQTKFFGEMKIDKGKLISFPQGLPGFDDLKEFAILNLPDESPFYCLQSIGRPEIAFLVIHPWDFFTDYDINIPDDDLADIGVEKIDQLLVYNILTVPEEMEKMTANLLGPIIINSEDLLGKQVILNDSRYTTKHLLFKQREVV